MDNTTVSERERDADLKRIARVVAAEILATAGAAATEVASVAAQTARTLSETTKLDLDYIKKDITEIKALLKDNFITVEAFVPVRNLVYGLVALILSGVFVGLLTLIIRK
jgi:hypothetical protein